MALLSLESGELSDIGRKRSENEDACCSEPAQGVFCIADGMGGVSGGDIASEAIVSAIQESLAAIRGGEAIGLEAMVSRVIDSVNNASRWIKAYADEKHLGQMGSTVVALVFDPLNPSRAAALHAGDSRLYRYRSGVLTQLTQDHSAEVALAQKYGCAPEDIPSKFQNRLLRAVGLKSTTELERTEVSVALGDEFILCSDGLSRMVSDEGIHRALTAAGRIHPAELSRTLVDLANQEGGRDNVTVVVVRVVGGASAPPPSATGSSQSEGDHDTIVLDASPARPPSSYTAGGDPIVDHEPAAGSCPTHRAAGGPHAHPEPDQQTDPSLHATTEIPDRKAPTEKDRLSETRPVAEPEPSASPEDAKKSSAAEHAKVIWPSWSWVAASVAVAACLTALVLHRVEPRDERAQDGSPQPLYASTATSNPESELAPPARGTAPDGGYGDAMTLSRQHLMGHRFEAAGTEARRAAEAKPGDVAAARMLEEIRRAGEDHAAVLRKARESFQLGKYSEARDAADQGLARFPKEPQLVAVYGNAVQSLEKAEAVAALTSRAREAAGRLDFSQALALIKEADLLSPGAPILGTLRTEIEESRRRFSKALSEISEAFQQARFEEATRRSEEALGLFPSHPQFLKLKRDSEEGLRRMADCKAAKESARQALEKSDLSAAERWIEKALSACPKDPEALSLQQQIHSPSPAAGGGDRDFEDALKAGQSALRQRLYAKAVEAAGVAARLKPDAEEPRALRNRAVEAQDLEEGKTRLNEGDYAGVERVVARHPESREFLKLKGAADEERAVFSEAKARLAAGDYAWFGAEERRGELAKAAFASLAARANDERRWLEELVALRIQSDAVSVRAKLAVPPYVELLGKAPFKDLQAWSAQSSDRTSRARTTPPDLDEINLTLQRLLVRNWRSWDTTSREIEELIVDPELRRSLENSRAGKSPKADKALPKDPARFVADLLSREDLATWRSQRSRAKALDVLRVETSKPAR
ncbi:MAG: protein phosphatase 2C domain-containing protein [Verrucomicrobia bacterium]|nr:protein phosphatase 2C domain-containing protein [Verrucomicrobiota bacterium]